MNRISTVAPTPKTTQLSFRLAPRLTLAFIGVIAAAAGALVLLLTFGPLSDLSAVELAAGFSPTIASASTRPADAPYGLARLASSEEYFGHRLRPVANPPASSQTAQPNLVAVHARTDALTLLGSRAVESPQD